MPKILLMVFKKAVLNLLAAGPVLLIGLIALNARTNKATWEFAEYGPVASQDIYAYITPISKVRQLQSPTATSAEVLDVADHWIQGYRNGELKDIKPASALLDGTSGPYLQILDAKHTLLDKVIGEGDKLRNAGDHERAVEVYLKAIEIGDIGKYGDFSSFTAGSFKQAVALRRVGELAPSLHLETRIETIGALSILTKPRKSFVDVIENVASAYRADRRRVGEEPIQLMLLSDQRLLASNQDPLAARLQEWQKLSAMDPDLISLYGKSRVGYMQHKQVTEAAMMTVSALDLSYVN